MQLTLQLKIPPLQPPIAYHDQIMLVGSCFTEHISDRLHQHKFCTLTNPHGILFNPLSVATSVNSYLQGKQYTTHQLFLLNETWNSWDHHTRFSHTDQLKCLEGINNAQREAAYFVHHASLVIITLGSAFQYFLKENGMPVSNNHRAPAQWFEKRLLSVQDITNALSEMMGNLFSVNPYVRVLFTISPVRHLRDGVVDNNRSKARLIEAVHEMCAGFQRAHYFPAYELVIDVLRDYRFYDVDFAHPNYLATQYVWEEFVQYGFAPDSKMIMDEVADIMTARKHAPRFPGTVAHRKFLDIYAHKCRELLIKHPFLDLAGELAYFDNHP